MPDKSSTSVANKILGTALAAISGFGLASLACAGLGAGTPAVLAAPGNFLVGAFSWAAAFVPLWFAVAAALAFLPGWRPGAIAALAGSVLPFLPIAAAARLSTESESLLAEHPYLAALGLPALLIAAAAAALALVAFVVYAARTLSAPSSGSPPDADTTPRPIGLLPPPLKESRGPVKRQDENFEFRVPVLPPLPPLHALETKGPDPKAESELKIEFTSIPPLRSQSEADEDAKAAALKRVLARRKEKDKPYFVPSEGILTAYPDGEYWIIDEKTKRSAEVLRDTLAEFKIEAEVTGIRKGPVITMFEILPAPGVKLSKITNLSDNIALRLAASSVRIVAPIPGKHAVGIEVPNEKRSIVSLREIVEYDGFKTSKMEIPVILGKDISGEAQFIDLTQTPHLLIAGATGSGKSVCVNAIILSILYRRSPLEVRLLLIDPKIVELKLYNDIPHLLTPVITEPKRAFQALQYCICEMERRYSLLDRVGVRDIKSYNRKIKDKGLAAERLPYIVVIIDEFADLMATTGKELESTLARLAAMSRAVGIHLVLATQRPSIDVITGLIKANIPSRIAFMVASKFDSRIIIDMVGAEKLLGRGDMLVATAWDPFPIRMQGAYVSEEEVEKAVEFVKTLGEPEYIDDEIFIDEEDEDGGPSLFGDDDDDPLFEKALEIVLQQGKASASYIQRRLKVGYNRASRLVELMEEKGIVGPAKGSKPRDLMHNPEVLGRATAMSAPRDPQRQPSLLPDIETTPGQRVTGKDDDEAD
jgi:S-DNA-T family DNA segregation ATPase FtsK/SpoIIIE